MDADKARVTQALRERLKEIRDALPAGNVTEPQDMVSQVDEAD
jgi:hypothetical protein